jgi:hypothetical protein
MNYVKPTDAQVNCYKNNFKFYINIDILLCLYILIVMYALFCILYPD